MRLTCSNAPHNSLGLGIVTNVQDLAGSDSLGVGILIHVNPILATEIYSFDFRSDAGGSGFAPAPIPNNPALVGHVYYAQSYLDRGSRERPGL